MQLAIIGGGNMGVAFAQGLLKKQLLTTRDLIIVEHGAEKQQKLLDDFRCTVVGSIGREITTATHILLAVKPQDFDAVREHLAKLLNPNQIVITIMAGITVATVAQKLAGHQKIVRCMPNLPVQLQEGVLVYMASGLEGREREQMHSIFSALGEAILAEDEKMLDVATSLSASGTGFVSYILACYCAKAEAMGLSPNDARRLVYKTFSGALSLLEAQDISPSELLTKVASKGGTTEAGVRKFTELKLSDALQSGLDAALERAIEIGRS